MILHETLGRFAIGIIKSIVYLMIGAVCIIPFVGVGLIALYGIATGDGIVLLAACIMMVTLIVLGGGLALKMFG